MRIIVPVSLSDMDKLPQWTQAIIHYGGLSNHTVSLLPTDEANEAAQGAAESLKASGVSAEVLRMRLQPYGGWPQGPNIHFFDACAQAASSPAPWLWMEVDCLPVRSGWADAIASAYSACGSKFMGCVTDTPWREPDGRIVKSPYGDEDRMLCGVAVYPPDMIRNPKVLPLLNDLVKGPDATPAAFDVHIRHAVAAIGRSHTGLIEDRWNTEGYRMRNGVLTCSGRASHPSLHPGWGVRNRGGDISPLAAIVHGCKDESLFELIIGGLDLNPDAVARRSTSVAAQLTETAGSGIVTIEPTDSDMRVAKLEDKVDRLTALLERTLLADKPTEKEAGREQLTEATAAKPKFSIKVPVKRGRPKKLQPA